MNQLINLLALSVTTLVLLHRVPGRTATRVIAFVFAIFFVLQFASLYTLDSFINYTFYNHLDLGDVKVYLFQFWPQIGLAILLLAVVWFCLYRLAEWLKRVLRLPAVLGALVLLGSVAVMSMPSGIFGEIYAIYRILSVDTETFDNALSSLGIDPERYPGPGDIHAVAGKNIVVISMESLERGFLGSGFPGLTPNLSRLSREYTYFDMPILQGTGWTAGSMYAHQVGVPALFKGQGNDFFQGVENVRLTGLGHVLNRAGYFTRYLIGKPEFAGTADLLGAYKLPVISEHNTLGQYPEAEAGLNDLDLFEEAKLQIRKAVSKQQPFAIFMSTINSHYPDGIHDTRMEGLVDTSAEGLEFSVASLDYLVGDFIEFLSGEGLLDETVVFLFPDHLLMGKTGKTLEKLKREKRSLYLVTNAGEDALHRDSTRPVYLVEFPRLLLDGAGISTNARFLADFERDRPLAKFVSDNARKLAALNQASVYRTSFAGGFWIELQGGRLLISARKDLDNIEFDIEDASNPRAFNVLFNGKMNFIEKSVNQVGDYFQAGKYDDRFTRLHLSIQLQDERIVAYLGDKKKVGIARSGTGRVEFSAEDIGTVQKSVADLAEIYQMDPGIARDGDIYADNILRITSSAWRRSGHLRMGDETYSTGSGLNLFLYEGGGWKVETFDTWWSESAAYNFAEEVQSLRNTKRFFVISVNNAVRNTHPGYKEALRLAGLDLLATLNGRTAYLAYPDADFTIREYASETSISRVIAVPPGTGSVSSAPVGRQDERMQDVGRFIAHAGGSIEGRRYTNSLEALEHSYREGFRLFELDIIETSDKHLVAAHDWQHWQKISAYQGPLPPTLEVFKSLKLHGKFSPLDMRDVNAWFADHPDAILVTDKVNDPARIASEFLDKSRLMMELFSLDAVSDGVKAGIRSAMPSWNVVLAIAGDRVRKLQDMGVTDVAASRRTVTGHATLLQNLKTAGIRVFAFHVNTEPGMDETYVVCEEMDYFYGLYADTWDFSAEPECGE